VEWVKRLAPPIVTGLGLAIMEATAQSMLGYHPTPLLIRLVSKAMPPFFLGMIITAIGAYTYAIPNTRLGTTHAIASIANTLAWEDAWYWVLFWEEPRPWIFHFLGLGVPYVVCHGVPIMSVTILAATTWVLIRQAPAGGSRD
jgi:hypothetical protein